MDEREKQRHGLVAKFLNIFSLPLSFFCLAVVVDTADDALRNGSVKLYCISVLFIFLTLFFLRKFVRSYGLR